MHSATKYLNGHSDMIGVVAITNSEKIAEEIGFYKIQLELFRAFWCFFSIARTKNLTY